MRCGSCGVENSVDTRFCTGCGHSLSLHCPGCQSAITATQKFCAECGQALGGAPNNLAGAELAGAPTAYTPPHLAQRILATRQALRGEKKQVTVLFCDLVESTALAHAVGAEAMHELLSEFFMRALEQVHHFEGTVNQFLGDGFMAIFGAPLAFEDHAARASLAALAIREATAQFRTSASLRGAERLQVRIGINSGQVVVGAIGDDLRMDYTAVGDTTHVAARLQSVAAPDEILCGEATVLAARDAIQTEPLGTVAAKGVAVPMQRKRLVNALALTSRVAHRRSALVGREVELERLRRTFGQLTAERGQVIEIVGEPGVGKSRLMLELAEALAPYPVVTGHCVAYGSQAPNVPIAGLVRGLCQIAATDSFDTQAQAVNKATTAATDHANYLGALLGLPDAIERIRIVDPATARGRTTAALNALVRAATARAPLVLIVEDLHWVDASSMDYLATMAAAVSSTHGLMIVTFRPGSEPRWGMGQAAERISLLPLIPMDGRILVERLTADAALSEQQINQVLARGEGNPLFIEELIRAVRLGNEELPGGLLGVIGGRIDRLEAPDKTVLSVAATLGREFPLNLVEQIAALDVGSRARVDRLIALGFIEPAAMVGRYTFVHALIQEVAYTNLLSPDRRRLHTAIAERVAATAATPAQVCEEVARHHLLGNTRAQAIPFLELAIGRALQAHALEAADGFFKDVLALLEAEPETPETVARRIRLVLQQFPAFHFTHKHHEYHALIERYRPIVEAIGNPALLGPFYAQLGHRLWTAARFGEARPVAESAAALCAQVGDHASAAQAEFTLTWLHGYAGEFARGEQHGLAALEHLKIVPVPFLQTFTHVGLLLNHLYRGQWEPAAAHGEQARQVGVVGGDDGLASFGGAFLSYAVGERGDSATAITLAERALAEAPTDYFRGWAYAMMAAALCRCGQVELGAPILEQATELARASGHIGGYSELVPLLIDARIRAGQIEQARQLAIELGEQSWAVDRPYITASADLALGELDLLARSADAASSHFQHAAEAFDRIGARHKYAQALFGIGRTYVAQGSIAAARGALQDALGIFRELGSLGAPEQVEAVLQEL